jgi:hypothetical protein
VLLRKIFGPNREELTRDWTRLHNEELHHLYTSQNIIRVIKLRRMRRVGHAARMGEIRNERNIFTGNAEGRRPLGRPRRRGEGCEVVDNESGSVYRPVASFCEDDNETKPLVSIKGEEFLD